MDLLTTVRKEGSRGGRGDFKWSDVQSSTHRENYLGHSLMAPVGRWQKGRDLNWYARNDDADEADGESSEAKAARERKDEISRIKEAEQDALARALGYEVPPKTNPNFESIKDRKEVDKILKETMEDGGTEIGQGVGYGKPSNIHDASDERIQGDDDCDARPGGLDLSRRGRSEKYRDRSRDRRHRSRNRSRNRSRSRRRRRRYHKPHRDGRHDEHDSAYRRRSRSRSRSRSRDRTRRRRSRSRERRPHRGANREERERNRQRSRSPHNKNWDTQRDRRYDGQR